MSDDDSEEGYDRFLQRYPVAELSPADLEEWVGAVLRSIGDEEGLSDLTVQVHERIVGVDGQFDVDATVRFRVLGLDFLGIVEVKKHRNRIKRDTVQILHSKVQSVGASKGIMFSTAHYQRGAIDFAKTHGIALVFVTEGRFMFIQRSNDVVQPASVETAIELGVEPIAGTYFGPGRADDASDDSRDDATLSVYIGTDRPDLVWTYLFDG